MNEVVLWVGLVVFAAGVLAAWTTAPVAGKPCGFCGEVCKVRPARHHAFGPVCRRCGRYFGLPES